MGNYFIVGGSSGIGKKLCQTLIEDGNRVYATYFKTEPDIESGSIEYHKLDITAEHIDLDFLPEHLDGMAYCPGSIHLAPFHRLKPADFKKDYELQVLGAIKVIQLVLPKLKSAEQASVVLFSTVAVQTGFPFHSLVSASKGAIEGLTKALAAEFAPKIRVNAIAPSITDTPLASRLLNSEDKKKANAERHPLQTIGDTGDIAHLAQFLLTAKSKWMTGQIIQVDGGISALRTI